MNENTNIPAGWPDRNGQPRKPRRWIKPTVLTAGFIVTGFVGVGIGAVGSSSEVQADRPTPTHTVTAEPIVETETITEEVTPQACITALDLSGEAVLLGADVIDAQSEAIMIAADALETPFAVGQSSIDRIVELTGQIEDTTAQIEAITPDAGAASSECRGA